MPLHFQGFSCDVIKILEIKVQITNFRLFKLSQRMALLLDKVIVKSKTYSSQYVHYMFTVCSPYMHYIFTICSQSIHCMFTIYSLCDHYIFTLCSQYVHNMFTACSLHISKDCSVIGESQSSKQNLFITLCSLYVHYMFTIY